MKFMNITIYGRHRGEIKSVTMRPGIFIRLWFWHQVLNFKLWSRGYRTETNQDFCDRLVQTAFNLEREDDLKTATH